MLVASVFATLLVSTPSQATGCQVTQPNHLQIPATVAARAQISGDSYTHGNGEIWTDLWPEGTVTFKKNGAGFILKDGSLQMKFLWVLAVDGPLTISGKRLDGVAPPLRSDFTPQVGAGFQPSYLIFPTQGCWEVTARANGSALTFVTRVVKTF